MRFARLLIVLAPFASLGAVMYGCGSTSRPEASAGDGTVRAEACATPGATRDCAELMSAGSGLRTCMHGTQTCTAAGAWGACVSTSDGLLESTLGPPPEGYDYEDQGGTLRPLARSTASPDARACANPCSADCVGYDEDAGPTTLDASLKLDALVPFPGTNPGFYDKVARDKCGGGGGTACELYSTGNVNTSPMTYACQADQYCSFQRPDGGGGCCQRFQPGQTHDSTQDQGPDGGGMGLNVARCVDAKPDLTVAGACLLNGKVIIPICNRGRGSVDAGFTVSATIKSPSGVLPTTTCYAGPNDCPLTLTEPLDPGECQYLVEGSGACQMNGNKLVIVNPTNSVAECSLDLRDSLSTGGNKPGCSNNYTAFNAAQLDPCPVRGDPKVLTELYSPSCPAGTRAEWGRLGWSASTPTGARVVFEVRSRPRFGDGGYGDWTPLTYGEAADVRIGGDPQSCPMVGGPAGCPVDIGPALGGYPATYNEQLEVRVTLSSTTAKFPTLYGWWVAYTCVAVE